MDKIKQYLKDNCRIPFMVRKNTNKYYKGYEHVIYFKYVYRVDGLFERLSELGFSHSPYLAEGGKYGVRVYIRKVSDEPIPAPPHGMYLWTCPECGKLYYIRLNEKCKARTYINNRSVCHNCTKENFKLYEKFRGEIIPWKK